MGKQPTLSQAAIDAIAIIREHDKEGFKPVYMLFENEQLGMRQDWSSGDLCGACMSKQLFQRAEFYKELNDSCEN